MATMRQLIEGLRGLVAEARRPAKAKAPQHPSATAGMPVAEFRKRAAVHRALAPAIGDYHSTEMGKLRRKKMAQDRDAPRGKSVGGEATMPGPKGEVDGKWVTVKGKRLFFPNKPGGDVPEGPWGGAPFRPGWTGRGGKFRASKGVMPQKGQLGLPGLGRGKRKRQEARAYGGRRLSEALAGIVAGCLAEYRTPGWSTTPSGKGGKVWNVKPPGKKGVWRTVGGKHVFYPQDGSGPWGGSPARPGWTKKSGKFRPTAKRGVKGGKAKQ
jgi:hypothetical protein